MQNYHQDDIFPPIPNPRYSLNPYLLSLLPASTVAKSATSPFDGFSAGTEGCTLLSLELCLPQAELALVPQPAEQDSFGHLGALT